MLLPVIAPVVVLYRPLETRQTKLTGFGGSETDKICHKFCTINLLWF